MASLRAQPISLVLIPAHLAELSPKLFPNRFQDNYAQLHCEKPRYEPTLSLGAYLSYQPKGVGLPRSVFEGFLTPHLAVYESAGILLGLCLYFPLYAECILQCAVGKHYPLSYWYGFTDDALSNLRIQPLLSNDFNPTTKKILKIQDEAGREPGGGVWPYINEQIKVAIWFRLIASH